MGVAAAKQDGRNDRLIAHRGYESRDGEDRGGVRVDLPPVVEGAVVGPRRGEVRLSEMRVGELQVRGWMGARSR